MTKTKQYSPVLPPMSHQLEAVRRAAEAPASPSPENVFGFLMEQGTGKSQTALLEWGPMAMSGGTQDMLVVGPAGSYQNWYVDKSETQLAELKYLDPALYSRLLIYGWEGRPTSKTAKKELELFLANPGNRPRVMVMNIEALSTVKVAIEAAKTFVSQRLCYMVVDESTKIKGDSNRTDAVVEIGEEAAVRRIMTGLVTPKSPLDLFHQFRFLDWRILGYKSIYPFKARYAIQKQMEVGGRKFKVVVGYQNVEELQEKIAPYVYRVLKKDCLDLEPKVFTTRDVELTSEQVRLYKELKTNATAELSVGGRHVSSQHAMTMVMRLHQINCGYVKDEEGEEHEVPSNRVRALLDVLEEHSGKAVIWAPHLTPIRMIVKALKDEYGDDSVAEFTGQNRATRGQDEKRFLSRPECRWMVATQGAGMMGNTWVNADLVVYYANDHDLEHREQSEDRCHRKGQVNRVTYVDLIARGNPIDMKILKNLRGKIDMATTITGDAWKEWLI